MWTAARWKSGIAISAVVMLFGFAGPAPAERLSIKTYTTADGLPVIIRFFVTGSAGTSRENSPRASASVHRGNLFLN